MGACAPEGDNSNASPFYVFVEPGVRPATPAPARCFAPGLCRPHTPLPHTGPNSCLPGPVLRPQPGYFCKQTIAGGKHRPGPAQQPDGAGICGNTAIMPPADCAGASKWLAGRVAGELQPIHNRGYAICAVVPLGTLISLMMATTVSSIPKAAGLNPLLGRWNTAKVIGWYAAYTILVGIIINLVFASVVSVFR